MRYQLMNAGVALAVAALLPAALTVGRWPSGGYSASAPLPAAADARPAPLGAEAVESMATTVGERAPFRRSRRPASVAYDPAPPETSVTEVPAVPKPVLVLAGFALGDRPVALLEGVPGLERAALLAEGETVAGLRIMRVRESGVVVTGYDTSWVLVLKEPWR